ncbi:MAG: TIGR01906 family membrane protein [Chloroflexota bacterium]
MKLKQLTPVFAWITTLFIPIAIIMLGVRILMTPMFLDVEYRMPGFPDDRYGFGMQDRLKWSKPSVEYLVNGAGIDYLANLKFADGQPIYNERELSHMADVKGVVQMLLKIWYVDLLVLIGFGFVSRYIGWWTEYLVGWKRGGFLTVVLLVALGVFASTSFWEFFAWFHSLFFSGNTWLFEYSDTLIRLFPIRFWEDAVAYIGGFSLILGLFLGFGLKPESK